MSYIPFVYCLTFLPTGQKYFGSRTAKNCTPDCLWTTYFTSSSVVNNLIKQFGKDAFIYKIRRCFNTKEETVDYEIKVLRRLKVSSNDNWLNKGVCGYRYSCQGQNNPAYGTKRNDLSQRNKVVKHRITKNGVNRTVDYSTLCSMLLEGWTVGVTRKKKPLSQYKCKICNRTYLRKKDKSRSNNFCSISCSNKNRKLLMVPPLGIEPSSPDYKTGASPFML